MKQTWQEKWKEMKSKRVSFDDIVKEMHQDNIWGIAFALGNHDDKEELFSALNLIKKAFERNDFSQNVISDFNSGIVFICIAKKIGASDTKSREEFRDVLEESGITKKSIADIIKMIKEQEVFFAHPSCRKKSKKECWDEDCPFFVRGGDAWL